MFIFYPKNIYRSVLRLNAPLVYFFNVFGWDASVQTWQTRVKSRGDDRDLEVL